MRRWCVRVFRVAKHEANKILIPDNNPGISNQRQHFIRYQSNTKLEIIDTITCPVFTRTKISSADRTGLAMKFFIRIETFPVFDSKGRVRLSRWEVTHAFAFTDSRFPIRRRALHSSNTKASMYSLGRIAEIDPFLLEGRVCIASVASRSTV